MISAVSQRNAEATEAGSVGQGAHTLREEAGICDCDLWEKSQNSPHSIRHNKSCMHSVQQIAGAIFQNLYFYMDLLIDCVS